jgi:hypothetical protein
MVNRNGSAHNAFKPVQELVKLKLTIVVKHLNGNLEFEQVPMFQLQVGNVIWSIRVPVKALASEGYADNR